MNNKLLKMKIILWFSLSLLSYIFTTPADLCVKAGLNNEAKSYADCKSYNDTSAETICCFVLGVNGGSDGTACVVVDMMFEGRVISYTNQGKTGTLICSDNSTTAGSGGHIKYNFILYLLFALRLK